MSQVLEDAQLRHKILTDAREILFEGWRDRSAVERLSAELEKRAPKKINPPNPQKVMETAESLYAFVMNPGSGTRKPKVAKADGAEG